MNGEFSSGSKNAAIGVTLQIGLPALLPDIDVDAFRDWLTTEFSCLPDAFSVQEVADTTGYNKHSVECWIRDGHLKCANVQGCIKIVPKVWLMEFYCVCGDIVNIQEGAPILILSFVLPTFRITNVLTHVLKIDSKHYKYTYNICCQLLINVHQKSISIVFQFIH